MEKNKIQENESVKAYKGFDSQLRCKDFQYEVGKSYEMDGDIKCCESGFHACENPLEVFSYYPPSGSRYCKVEQSGTISKDRDDSKKASSKIHIQCEIGLKGIIEAGVKFIMDKVNCNDDKKCNTGNYSAATNTGYQSAATNTGDHSAATNTGDRSAATNTGYQSATTNTGYHSAATNTGDRSAATNTGYHSAATNTGDHSAATNTGDHSAATNTGDWSAATNTGYQSAATNTGNYSAATNTGDWSAATNTGDHSAAKVGGADSIAIVTGKDSKAAGAIGDWIVLTERDDDWHISDVKAVKVDGEIIKPDTWYQLINGEIKEVK